MYFCIVTFYSVTQTRLTTKFIYFKFRFLLMEVHKNCVHHLDSGMRYYFVLLSCDPPFDIINSNKINFHFKIKINHF